MAEAKATPGHEEYLAVIFRRCVLAILGARVPENCVLQRDAVEYIVMLAEEHMLNIFEHLSSLCRTQRRSKPSMEDIALLLFFEELNVIDLEREKRQTVELEQTAAVTVLNNLAFDLDMAPLHCAQSVFFETPNSLAPSSRARPSYMPSWMPALPPEHTYMHTEDYSSGVKDLRHVRQHLVEEGHLAEVALQRLIGDRGSASVIELPREGHTKFSNGEVVVVDQEMEVPATRAKPRGLSLRISLGKTKKRKEDVLGKRPRLDVAELARRRAKTSTSRPDADESPLKTSSSEAANGRDGSSQDVDYNERVDSPKDSDDMFKAALASFAGQ